MIQSKQRLLILLVLLSIAIGINIYFKSQSPVSTAINPQKRLQPMDVSLPDFQSPYIDDQSRLLGAFQHHLHRMAQDWYDSLGIEVQVVTVNAPDQKIAELTNTIFRQREIGKDAATGGVLILIETGNQAARIEVSYSLETVFTDAMIGLLAHDQLAPYASYQVEGMAIMDVLHFLKEFALEQAVLGGFKLPDQYRMGAAFKAKQLQFSGGAGAQVDISQVPTDVDFKKPVPASQLNNYLPATTPQESLEAYKRSLKNYVGDPDLILFTEGSQLMRKQYPFAPFEELLRLRRLMESEPLKYTINGQYAVAISDHPAHGFTPVLMKKIDGKWRIDIVEVWKNIFFDPDGNYFLKNNNSAYAFGLEDFGKGRYYNISPLPVGDGQLKNAINELAHQDSAISHFRLAELLFRNAFTALQALTHYEHALRLAPNDPLIQSTYAERVLYLGFPELAIPVLKKMGASASQKLVEALVATQNNSLAVNVARVALNENPYSLYALRMLNWALEQDNQKEEATDIQRQIDQLQKDIKKRYQPVWLTFYPKSPLLRTGKPTKVNNTAVYDYSNFTVSIKNYSKRPVKILSVNLISAGTGRSSGLGDIKDYWKFVDSNRILESGELRWFEKTWGFTVDPGHDRLSYIFHVCWRGEDEDTNQCNTQTLHLTTDKYALWNNYKPTQGEGLEGLWYESNREDSHWVLDIHKVGSIYEGRYAQLSGKNVRFKDGELVFKAALNSQGQLEGNVLIKYGDDIKKLCSNAADYWTPITLDISLQQTRMQGKWQSSVINVEKQCSEKKERMISYMLDKL